MGTGSIARGSDRLFGRLSRVTTPGRRFIPELDGIRFVAIALVVIVHAVSTVYKLSGGAARFPHIPQQDIVWWLGQEGIWGVQLFFVISGFILALPFAAQRLGVPNAKPVAVGRYYLRRVTRLEPSYLIGLTMALAGAVAIGGASLGDLFPNYAAGTAYLHGTVYGTPNPAFLVAWSLEVEVQFYLLAPLLAMIFSVRDARLRRGAIVAVAATAVVVHIVVDPYPGWAAFSLLASIQYFLLGFLLADLYLVEWRGALPERAAAWDLGVIAATALFVWLAYGPPRAVLAFGPFSIERGLLRELLFPPLAFIFIVAAFRGSRCSRWLSNPWVFTIGGMCYSIYLTHTLVIDIARKVTLRAVFGHSLGLTLIVQVILTAPVVLAAGTAFFVLVERPCMDPLWPRKLAARLRRGTGTG